MLYYFFKYFNMSNKINPIVYSLNGIVNLISSNLYSYGTRKAHIKKP